MNELVVEDIVTKFLLNTCRLRSQLTLHAAEAARICVYIGTADPASPAFEVEGHRIPLISGSAAEFYIEPMLKHINDIDVMAHLSTMLAIPRGHPPPIQLPTEFHNYVEVYEIIDSHLPGYVYLELRYLLTQCDDDGNYNYVKYQRNSYLPSRLSSRFYDDPEIRGLGLELHGPALTDVKGGIMRTDLVHCVRCLVWPTEAADWPTRHRKYGWPDTATVDSVVSNGCDMVRAVHRQCRQHEWRSEHQFRLSFSRAEIVLINSWMKVQQIFYHMLRVFMKTEQFTDSDDNSEAGTLSNYHIKTLMLWACELKPRNWWTGDISLVKICVELLHDLADWLTKTRGLHYFINKCHLIDSSFNIQVIASRLIPITTSQLSWWFVNNYIRRCSDLCPDTVSQLFDNFSTTVNLQNAVSEIIDWRPHIMSLNTCSAYFAEHLIAYKVSRSSLTARSCACCLTELRKTSECLSIYFASVCFLHVAYRISSSGLTDELMNLLDGFLGHFIDTCRHSIRRNSVFLVSKAVITMKAVDDRLKSRNAVQLIAIQLSKEYLHRALSCEDSDSDSIYCLTNVYLAVLYYTTSQYQTAIDHCTLVMRSQDHSRCSSRVVQGEILPKTDDEVNIALGLAMFYQHVRMAALNQQQQTYVTVFTTELFAHYLYIKCMSVIKCQQLSDTDTDSWSSTYEVRSYVKYITNMQQLFVTDICLWKLLHCFSGYKVAHKQQSDTRNDKHQGENNSSDLVELLQLSAVEYLTKYRQLQARDCGPGEKIVTTDFEALYAYKRGDYQQCLQLSTQNVHTLLYAVLIPKVDTMREFIQLLDGEIIALAALILLPNGDDSYFVTISQLTLSLYLMTRCQLKLRHSVMLLAQTLDYIEVAQKRHQVGYTLNQLVLKLIAQEALSYSCT